MEKLRFTGKTERINVSLPSDMIAVLRAIQNEEGIPVSRQARFALADWLTARVAAKHAPATHKLVDTAVSYGVEAHDEPA